MTVQIVSIIKMNDFIAVPAKDVDIDECEQNHERAILFLLLEILSSCH